MGEKFGRILKNDVFQFGYGVEFEVESYCAIRATSSPTVSTPTPIC